VEVVASNGLEAVRITTPVGCFFGLVLLGGGIGLLTACCSESKFNPRLVNASFSHDDDVEEEERKVGLRTVVDDEEDTDLHVMIFLWNTKSFPDLESIGE